MATDKIRLLIVDDNLAVKTALEERLSRVPEFELVVGHEDDNSGDVLTWIQKAKPDVVLFECKRHDGRGMQLCQDVLELEENPEVVVLTSYIDDDERLAAKSMGVRRYLLKEIASSLLIAEIRAAYDDRRARCVN